MKWHVQHRDQTGNQVTYWHAPEIAIEEACRLIDEGFEVFGIGTGPLSFSIGKEEIARIYAMGPTMRRPRRICAPQSDAEAEADFAQGRHGTAL